MDSLIKQAKAAFKELERVCLNITKTGKDKRTKSRLTTQLQLLEFNYSMCTEHHAKIISAAEEADQKNEYFGKDLFGLIQDRYVDIRCLLQDQLDEMEVGVNGLIEAPAVVGVVQDTVRLPPVPLPRFDGGYMEWPSFRDHFMKIVHTNNQLSNFQKLHYLKSHLDAEAATLLKHYQVTDVNYQPAWDHLKKRYDNTRILVNMHLKALLDESFKPQESAQTIRSIIDKSNEAIEGLRGLGVNIDEWDAVLVFLITRRLPNETHRLWEHELGASTDIPTYVQLIEFLDGRFRTLEMVSQEHHYPQYHRNDSVPRRYRGEFNATSGRESCVICQSSVHKIQRCAQFVGLSHEKKLELVRRKSLCINCLNPGHRITECRNRSSCMRCHKRHHTLLHRQMETSVKTFATTAENKNSECQNASKVESNSYPVGIESTSNQIITNHHVSNAGRKVLLATALINVVAPNGIISRLRALLDQGSQASLITEAAVQHMKLQKVAISASIKGLGNAESCTSHSLVSCGILDKNGKIIIELEALVLRTLTDVSAQNQVRMNNWSHLKGIELADPEYLKAGKIDMLLGADVYAQVLEEGLIKGSEGGPMAQKTKLGWILSGEIEAQQTNACVPTIKTFLIKSDLNDLLEKFWKIEDNSTSTKLTEDENLCEEIFQQTTRRQADGRYIVTLPYKKDATKTFGKSRDRAVARLLQLESKMKTNEKLKKDYCACINEYLELGHMEPIQRNKKELEHAHAQYTYNYLPHHAVFKESTTTKTRVVFDASSKNSDGLSLNDKLLIGPTIQSSLLEILLRWRKFEYVFTADLHKMYRQIRVDDADCKAQQIVWRNNPNEPIKDYRLKTVTFGTASAPFLAIRTLNQLADDELDRCPLAMNSVRKEFYVDDLLSGGNSLQEAGSKQNQLIQLMKLGKFELRKWSSNNANLLINIPRDYIELEPSKEMELDQTIKTLGLHWNASTDSFTYKVKQDSIPEKRTKRAIVSDIAKLFDPVGWVSPVVIRAKILIQKLWLTGLNWDDTLPMNIVEEWSAYRNDLVHIEELNIKRWIRTNECCSVQLHGFSDASKDAYAAVVYLRVESVDTVSTHLLTSKTRVAPIKTITLPRLELCGAVLLSNVLKLLIDTLEIEQLEVYAWCDSKIVLDWIKGNQQRWNVFVKNRIAQIKSNIKATWSYVPSGENPADCASRGMTPKKLKSHTIWWIGPSWLSQSRDLWPEPYIHAECQLECRNVIKTCNFVSTEIENFLKRYSNLNTLIRITALCFRFMYNTRNSRNNRKTSWLTTNELNQAHNYWVKCSQFADFTEEMQSIQQGRNISTKSKIISLNPFLDNDGILRVGGRLSNSDLSFSRKHPIILDHRNILSELIVQEAHEQTLHGGSQLMTSYIRQRYWITDLRNTIRRQVHKCMRCFRERAATTHQLMGNLPKTRITPAKPFFHTGVDYCGPFEIKASIGRSPKMIKSYVAIFICMVTKAVHTELVSCLTTSSFIAAFRRFVGRRGYIGHINMYSDNATNFVGASRQLLKDIEKSLTDESIARVLTKQHVSWHFIPPRAPNFGGLWESAVRSAKYHMKRVLVGAKLNYEEFGTALVQIEACMNSRPLLPITNDPSDLSALTPGHFLTGDVLLGIPEPSLDHLCVSRLDRWQYVQKLHQSFWKQWSSNYLHTLQQRSKWLQKQPNIIKDTMVLVKEDNLPSCRWLLGRVMDTHEGTDGLVRVVLIRTKNGVIKRPISKICPLPSTDL